MNNFNIPSKSQPNTINQLLNVIKANFSHVPIEEFDLLIAQIRKIADTNQKNVIKYLQSYDLPEICEIFLASKDRELLAIKIVSAMLQKDPDVSLEKALQFGIENLCPFRTIDFILLQKQYTLYKLHAFESAMHDLESSELATFAKNIRTIKIDTLIRIVGTVISSDDATKTLRQIISEILTVTDETKQQKAIAELLSLSVDDAEECISVCHLSSPEEEESPIHDKPRKQTNTQQGIITNMQENIPGNESINEDPKSIGRLETITATQEQIYNAMFSTNRPYNNSNIQQPSQTNPGDTPARVPNFTSSEENKTKPNSNSI